MADIGTIVPAATRVEPADILVGNVVEHGGDTRDIPITALRRSNANHDIESINNSVRLKTNGVVGVLLAQNGDFSVHGADIFTKKSNGFTGFGGTNSANRVSVSGGLAVGSGFTGTTAPTNGAIIEGGLGVGTDAPTVFVDFKTGANAVLNINSTHANGGYLEVLNGSTLQMRIGSGKALVANGTLNDAAIRAQSGKLFLGAGSDDHIVVDPTGLIGIGISSSFLAKLHIAQANSSDAIPVLTLDQSDVSEEMIQFESTIGEGNAIEAVGAKSLTTTHFIKFTITGGLTVYMPVGTIA